MNYLDQVQLFVVDHPEGTEANPNEYFAAEPPFPADTDARHAAARDCRAARGTTRATIVLPAPPRARIASTSRTFRTRRSRASRRCTRSSSTSATSTPRGPLHLLMRGFTDYFTATSMYAANQARCRRHRPVSRGAARRRIVEARQRRHRLPRRPASHDDGGPHGKAPRRHAAHPHLDEPEGLLGPGARGHDAGRRRFRSTRTEMPLVRGVARVPRLPARDPRHADGRHPVQLQRRQPSRGPTRGIAASTRGTATSRRSFATPRITSSSSDRATTSRLISTRRSCRRFGQAGRGTTSSISMAS